MQGSSRARAIQRDQQQHVAVGEVLVAGMGCGEGEKCGEMTTFIGRNADARVAGNY